ncbi:MAG: hypothetical protein ACI9DJ_003038 [Algoriphagus sp.]|jgi:hypothetical protein
MKPIKILQNVLFLTLAFLFTGLLEHCEVLLDLNNEVSIVDAEFEEEKAEETSKILCSSEANRKQKFSEKQMLLLHLTASNYLFNYFSELEKPPDFKVI